MRITESQLRRIIKEIAVKCGPKSLSVLSCESVPSPNEWGDRDLVLFRVDLGPLEDMPTGKIPGFSERLLRLIPTLTSHRCSHGVPGGFVRRMTEGEGTWMGHVMEHVALELQCLRGHDVGFGRTRGAGPRGVYNVWFECLDPRIGERAGWEARDILLKVLRACEIGSESLGKCS